MPIYDYKCHRCGYVLENVLVFSSEDTHDVFCPECNEMDGAIEQMVKLIGASSAHFKGSGFHNTDYKDKK